jgi:hypothetical protein
MNAGDPGWAGLDPQTVQTVRGSLDMRARDDPDFWVLVGQTELEMYEALSRRGLAAIAERLARDFNALKQRVPSARMWGSVYDNAQFLLGFYAKRVQEAEVKAANDLVAVLRRLASTDRIPEPGSASGAPRVKTAGSA